MSKVTLIDYGIGNLLSVERAFRHLGADFGFARTADEIEKADKLVLPGVGAFTSCTGELEQRGLSDAIRNAVAKDKPMLGICVGMQMLFEGSEEFGLHPGFGFLKGTVKAIPATGPQGHTHKIPHIAWAPLRLPEGRNGWEGTLLEGTPEGAAMYFVHSFTAAPVNDNDRLADTWYDGCLVSAMVNRGNLYGTQFHPEKSGKAGLKILENFIAL